ncbi:thioester domain-containing protein [Furfurilactobacillus entadae]|uniref:thioester domain-containing protein n=1 Tax=Furfurilactobacillus entadae TaxID=2922307 RepID=UPI0035E4B296
MKYSRKQLKKMMQQVKHHSKTLGATGAIALSLSGVFATPLMTASADIDNNRAGLGQEIYGGDNVGYMSINGDAQGENPGYSDKNPGSIVTIQYGGSDNISPMRFQGHFAYCLQNGSGTPINSSGQVKGLNEKTNVIMRWVMALGFPNDPSTLGFTGDNAALHAYAATQQAVWAAENGNDTVIDANHQNRKLADMNDAAGVNHRAEQLYQDALKQSKNGTVDVDSLTKNTQSDEKQKAEDQLNAELQQKVNDWNNSAKDQVNKKLADDQTAKKSTMQAFMSKTASDKFATINASADINKVLADAKKQVDKTEFAASAELSSPQYSYHDEKAKQHVFTFESKTSLPTFSLAEDKLSKLIPDKQVKLDTSNDGIQYQGTFAVATSGTLKAVDTVTSGSTTKDIKVNAVKFDNLPEGAKVYQGGQELKAVTDDAAKDAGWDESQDKSASADSSTGKDTAANASADASSASSSSSDTQAGSQASTSATSSSSDASKASSGSSAAKSSDQSDQTNAQSSDAKTDGKQNASVFLIQDGKQFQVKVPDETEANTDRLSYHILGTTEITAADFSELATVNMKGNTTVSESTSDTIKDSKDYSYQKGASVEFTGSRVPDDGALQATGVLTLASQPQQATDTVNGSQAVKYSDSQAVNDQYSAKSQAGSATSVTETRSAGAEEHYSWDKQSQSTSQASQASQASQGSAASSLAGTGVSDQGVLAASLGSLGVITAASVGVASHAKRRD